MNKQYKIPGILFLLILFCFLSLQGCIQKDGPVPISEMTPQQKTIMMFDLYNSEYRSYMLSTGYIKDSMGAWKKTSQPIYTDDQIKILRAKKAILVEVYPLIKIFDSYVKNGALTTPEMEDQIFHLLDQLVKLIPD